MVKFILITGGARSCESSYVLRRVEKVASRHGFFTTCPAVDAEMAERIPTDIACGARGGVGTVSKERRQWPVWTSRAIVHFDRKFPGLAL
jgi:hypothetical protein